MIAFKIFKIFFSSIIQARKSRYLAFKQRYEVFRILFSLNVRTRLKQKNEVIRFKVFGYIVYAYNYQSLLYIFREIFLNRDYYFDSSIPDPKILDCGANIGLSVLYFKMLYPNCKIRAFEPNPQAFTLLERNVGENNLEHVTLINAGLSAQQTKVDFYFGSIPGSGVGSVRKDRGGVNSISVNVVPLSSYLKNTKVNLIKMDVEGSEWEIMKDLLTNNVLGNSERYIIEYHHKINQDRSCLSGFLSFFEDNHFEYNLRTSFECLGKFQDILLYVYRKDDAN